MAERRNWSEIEVTEALSLYLRLPFGKFHSGTPQIIQLAGRIGRTPSSVAMKLSNLAALDKSLPQKGLAKASAMDRQVWTQFLEDPSFVLEVYEAEFQQTPPTSAAGFSENRQAEWNARQSAPDIRPTAHRRGQSFFREMILSSYQTRCAVTGISDPRLLTASHIVGWQENEKHRLDPENGICLNALHDRAFDRHMISFDENYRMIIADDLSPATQHALCSGARDSLILPERFLPRQAFLAHHRKQLSERRKTAPLA